jgi:hypothetical protein
MNWFGLINPGAWLFGPHPPVAGVGVQTFCIDPPEEVFGGEVRTGVMVSAAAGEWVALLWLWQVRSKSRKGQPPGAHTTCSGITPSGLHKCMEGNRWMVRCVFPYFYWKWSATFRCTRRAVLSLRFYGSRGIEFFTGLFSYWNWSQC